MSMMTIIIFNNNIRHEFNREYNVNNKLILHQETIYKDNYKSIINE